MPAEHTTRAIAAVHAVLCTGAVNDDGRRNHSPRKASCAQGLRRPMHTTLRRHGAWMPACPWTAKSSQVSLPEPWGPPLFFSSGHRSLHVGPASVVLFFSCMWASPATPSRCAILTPMPALLLGFLPEITGPAARGSSAQERHAHDEEPPRS
jgi:hypothetical protein